MSGILGRLFARPPEIVAAIKGKSEARYAMLFIGALEEIKIKSSR